MQTAKQKYHFKYEIWDKFEGKITGQVFAYDDNDAEYEAEIAASERGCSMIEEINVYKVNDS